MPRASMIVQVDEQLTWVVAVPELALGETRPATPDHLEALTASFDWLAQLLATADTEEGRQRLLDHVEGAVRQALGEAQSLPQLPFIGEPFGGDDGTD